MNPKAKGELAEGIILAALLRCGYAVSMPFGNKQRYDLIVDDRGSLLRAQCKTGRLIKGCVVFKTSSVNGFTGARRPDNDTIYRVPIAATGTSMMQLRIEPLKQGAPRSTVKWARDFELR